MPYTEATIREILRLETGVPSGVAHAALIDTKLCGYDLPKVLIMNWIENKKKLNSIQFENLGRLCNNWSAIRSFGWYQISGFI